MIRIVVVTLHFAPLLFAGSILLAPGVFASANHSQAPASALSDALPRDNLFDGNLFDTRDKLEAYVSNLSTRSIFAKQIWKRIDFRWPSKAIQEGIINALMHRDYSSPSGSVAISVYPDRFVISNSGGLPSDLSIKDLKHSHRSHPVNPDIAHIVFLRGLIDKLGRGTVKLVEECRENGLKDPAWSQTAEGLTLTFNGPKERNAKKQGGVNVPSEEFSLSDNIVRFITERAPTVSKSVIERRARIAQTVLARPGIKATELNEDLPVSRRLLLDDIRLLVAAGLFHYKGSKRSGGYYPSEELEITFNRASDN